MSSLLDRYLEFIDQINNNYVETIESGKYKNLIIEVMDNICEEDSEIYNEIDSKKVNSDPKNYDWIHLNENTQIELSKIHGGVEFNEK